MSSVDYFNKCADLNQSRRYAQVVLSGTASGGPSILCDTERRVVKDWDIYNSRERGGIAKPSVFVIDPNQVVRYASVDSVATRVPAVEIVHLLQSAANAQPIRRRVHIPMLSEWIRAIRNHFQS